MQVTEKQNQHVITIQHEGGDTVHFVNEKMLHKRLKIWSTLAATFTTIAFIGSLSLMKDESFACTSYAVGVFQGAAVVSWTATVILNLPS